MADERYGAVVKNFGSLRKNVSGRLDARVLRTKRSACLDIREFVSAENFEGYTRKGIRLTAEEFSLLLVNADEIQRLLAEVAG